MKKVKWFIFVTVLLCIPFYYMSSIKSLRSFSVFFIMWIPAVSAFIIKLISDKSLRGFGWKPGKLKYLITGYLIPLVGGLIVYGAVWLIGLGDFSNEMGTNIFLHLVRAATIGIIFSMLTALGEEIGWRGFLVPLLMKKKTLLRTSLFVSVIWSLYHIPGLLTWYSSGMNSFLVVIFFTMQIAGLSYITSWLRVKSNSLWPAVLLHASHNLFVQRVFDVLTVDTGITKYITTDFGIGLALFYLITTVVLIYYEKKN